MDFNPYGLAAQSTHDEKQGKRRVAKLACKLQVQLKYQLFEALDLMSIIIFLMHFKKQLIAIESINEPFRGWLPSFLREKVDLALTASLYMN